MSSVRVHQSKLISKCMIRSEAWSAKRVLTSARQNRHRHTGILASSIPAKHASDCMRWEQMLTLRVKQNNLLTFVVTVNYSLQKTRPLQFRWVEYLTSYYARRHVKCSDTEIWEHEDSEQRALEMIQSVYPSFAMFQVYIDNFEEKKG